MDYNPELESGVKYMEFRLTYDGDLRSGGDASHKHSIRKVFHKQLKQLWQVTPALVEWSNIDPCDGINKHQSQLLANSYQRCGYRFVPLVIEEYGVLVSLDVLFLRPGEPGTIIQAGDIDNRLKVLFDALRMPNNKPELGGYESPDSDEDPFYCLLLDDKLVASVHVVTDTLLQPSSTSGGPHQQTFDCRLVVTVGIRRYKPLMWNPFQ